MTSLLSVCPQVSLLQIFDTSVVIEDPVRLQVALPGAAINEHLSSTHSQEVQ